MDRKVLLERFVATWHARDVDGITAMLAPDFEYLAASVHVPSAEGLIAMARGIWQGTPDEHVELVNVIVDGDRLAAEVRTTATHKGLLEFGRVTLPATGRPIDIMTVWVMTFKGDLLYRWNEYGNVIDWIEQMVATVTITPHAG